MMFVHTSGAFLAQIVGMLGTPGSMEMVSRDGKQTLMSDIDHVNAYGESWQVKDIHVMQLFQEALGPQCLEKCL
jgi:hypothetical protein